MTRASLCVALALCAAFGGSAHADERKNAINVNPGVIFLEGLDLSYERMLSDKHALVITARGGRSHDDGGLEAWSAGLMVGYRWHWSGGQDSGFLGVDAGGFVGEGDLYAVAGDGDKVKLARVRTDELAIIGSIGRRFAWDNGFNITVRAGVGLAGLSMTYAGGNPDLDREVKEMNQRNQDELLDYLAFDGELSIGYAFK